MTAIAILNREAIIEQVANGNLLDQVASGLDIAAPNISKHLAADPEYHQARQIGAQLRLERSYARLAKCDEDGMPAVDSNLVRAREAIWRASAWFAEREYPERYGQKVEAKIDASLTVHVVRLAAEGMVIEHEQIDDATHK